MIVFSKEVAMRLPLILAALAISAPAASEGPALQSSTADSAGATAAVVRDMPGNLDKCRASRAHLADGRAAWIGEPLEPKKLDELPKGTAYMAVYRTINGCEVPLSVVEYRRGSGR
jgi:hypothetical protein